MTARIQNLPLLLLGASIELWSVLEVEYGNGQPLRIWASGSMPCITDYGTQLDSTYRTRQAGSRGREHNNLKAVNGKGGLCSQQQLIHYPDQITTKLKKKYILNKISIPRRFTDTTVISFFSLSLYNDIILWLNTRYPENMLTETFYPHWPTPLITTSWSKLILVTTFCKPMSASESLLYQLLSTQDFE